MEGLSVLPFGILSMSEFIVIHAVPARRAELGPAQRIPRRSPAR